MTILHADHFTPAVAARTAVAKELKERYLAKARDAGIKEADLTAVIDAGTRAAEADRLQHEELAGIQVDRHGRSQTAGELMAQERKLKNRLPAVVADVAATDAGLAAWLGALSFARYGLHELAPAQPAAGAATATADAEVRKVQRVAKEGKLVHLSQLANFCDAILSTGREAIVAAFAERGFSRDALTALAADARALADKGRNVTRKAAHTDAESAAVGEQAGVWARIRAMVHEAVAGVPELSSRLVDTVG